ncbi:DUF1295-domain-containing protein [Exidia glandulosa HHB12029]|uniref:DUF1295-domain-containing protein n=1 Tax=Exidia glandulosa HHB12029 TaxID=1314781 RepID=A0A165HHR9_EXIGL|nr:DUF1295-domain-containing protein [Exidia glandulosa HHB12029]
MTAVHVLDDYYLAITLLFTIGYQLTGFAIAWTCQFDKITDLTGGTNFFFVALFTLLAGHRTDDARSLVASLLVMAWAVRIAGFLFTRVMIVGSDSRFNEIRAGFFSFMGFWIAQIIWVWVVSLPVIILNSPAAAANDGHAHPSFGTGRDIAGIIIWALGLVIETVADAHKFRWRQSKVKKTAPLQSGFWAWSRHPPYFGEMLCWWGIWTICISPAVAHTVSPAAGKALYGSVVSPLITFLILMFFSGVPTAEKPQAKKYYLMTHGPGASPEDADVWPAYKAYLRETSILLPIPRSVYRPLPEWMKRTLLMDFTFFNFNERVDGPRAVEEARRKENDV